jgi:hypothetical protein
MDQDSLTRRRSWWENSWGANSTYYLDAVAGRYRMHAILAAHDLWEAEKLHLDSQLEVDIRPFGTVACCGRTRTSADSHTPPVDDTSARIAVTVAAPNQAQRS